MTPGPIIIRKCSSCGELLVEYTLGSGNTCGARFWTDGKCEAPMLPDTPWLVKCRICAALIWIDEQEKIAEFAPWDRNTTKNAQYIKVAPPHPVEFSDYLAALSEPATDANKTHYLRMRAWWSGNDRRRRNDSSGAMDDEELGNTRALVLLFDEADEYQRLLKAEAYRELSMFTEAESLLNFEFSTESSSRAATIRVLAKDKLSIVQELVFD